MRKSWIKIITIVVVSSILVQAFGTLVFAKDHNSLSHSANSIGESISEVVVEPTENTNTQNYTNPLSSVEGLTVNNPENTGMNAILTPSENGLKITSRVGSGNNHIIDNNLPVALNGTFTVDLNPTAEHRAGILLRYVNSQRYLWVGFNSPNFIIIREMAPDYINRISPKQTDIYVQGVSCKTRSTLSVTLNGKNVIVVVGGVEIYNGPTPFAKNNIQVEPVAGKSGLVVWDKSDNTFKNLTYTSSIPPEDIPFTNDELKYLNEKIYVGLGKDQFTAESWAALKKAVDDGKIVCSNKEKTEPERINAVKAAIFARKTLVLKNATEDANYVNEFTSGKGNLTQLKGDLNQLIHANGNISHSVTGELSFLDNDAPILLNGSLSADLVFNKGVEPSRTALMFRYADAQNYSFVGVEHNNLRIRECVNNSFKDIEVSVPNMQNAFNLRVDYYDDIYEVFINNKVVYFGSRPFAKDVSKPHLLFQPVFGRSGLYTWSVHNFTLDNLRTAPFSTRVINVAVDNQEGLEIDTLAKKITIFMPSNADLFALTPTITTLPSDVVVSPSGSQDFTKGPINYTVDNAIWEIKVILTTSTLDKIEDAKLSVRLNKQYPQVFDYMLKGSNTTMLGAASDKTNYVYINDKSYPAEVVYNKVSNKKATYNVTLKDVALGNNIPKRTVTFTYTMEIVDGVLVKTITNLVGDDKGAPFKISFAGATLSVAATTNGAQIATSGESENTIFNLNSSGKINRVGVSYAMVAGGGASATVILDNQYTRPFNATITGIGNSKIAKIQEQPFVIRFADGARAVKEISEGITEPLQYVARIHICGDANKNGKVDWQDSAIWLRSQIAQVPKSLASHFMGGNWKQAHGAFAGNGNTNPTNYKAATTMFSFPSQYVEIQRQLSNLTDGVSRVGFAFVGWQGRGHDYGWPNINEVPLNPVYGSEAEYREAQKKVAEYGGSLGFHVNMTDMTNHSESYKRGNTPSEFGNIASSTGVHQYSNFGWSATKINHYTDYPFALNRQNAFVKRFESPFILYQDVLLAYPMGAFGETEERYAMWRENEHWKTLGSYAATEYYYSEKRSSGTFMMKNYQNPNTVDEFVIAGQTYFHNTHSYQTQPQDYIWANLYSDNANTGNVMTSQIMTITETETATSMLLSLVNSYVAKGGLLEYVNNGTEQYTLWGNGKKYSVNNSTGQLHVTKDGTDIAHINVSGTVHGDAFVPASDDTSRIFAYSTDGGSKTWTIPSEVVANSFKLYRLTCEGREYITTLTTNDGKITFTQEPKVPYVLDYKDSAVTNINQNENYNQNVPITASSRNSEVFGPIANDYSPVGAILDYVPASKAPANGWKSLLAGLTNVMITDTNDLAYYKYVYAGMTADNLDNTYWKPENSDYKDGNVFVEFTYPAAHTVSYLELDILSDGEYDVVITGIDSKGAQKNLYSGKVRNRLSHKVDTPVELQKLRLTVYTGKEVLISEFGAYETPVI